MNALVPVIFPSVVYIFFRPTTLIGRNVGISDYFIYSSNPNNFYISRNHARVIRSTQDNSHKLVDMSLTGVFVNDVKIDGEIVLQEGDTVTFGHPEGKIISPGTKVRQASSEYYFLFQRCCCDADGTSPLPSTVTTCTAQTQLQLPVLTSVHIPYFGHPGFFLGTNSQFPFPSGLWAAPTTTSSSSSTLSLSQSSSEFTRKNTTLSQFVPSTVTVLSAVPDNGCNSECNAAVAAKSGEETPLHSSFQKAALSKLPSESSQCHGVLEASDETAFSQGDVHKVDKGALEQVTEKSVNINSYGAAGVEVRPTSGQFHRPFLDEQNCQKASFGSSAVTKAPEGGSTFHLTLPLSEAGSPVNELESDCDELLHGVETIQIQSKDEITNESVKEDCKLLVPNSESDILLADVHMNEDNEVCPAIPLPQEVRTHAGVSVKECAIISSTNAPLTGEFKQCEVSEEYGESNTAAAQTCRFENTSTFHPLAICMEEKSYVDENTDSSQLESPEMCASNVFEPENEDQPELSESVYSENVAFSTVDKGKIPDSLSVKGSESQFSVESDLEVAGDSGLSSPEMNLTKDEQGCNDEPLILKMVRSVHVADESFTNQSSSLGKEHLESDTSPLMCKTSAHTCNSGSFVSRIDEVDNTFLIMSTSIDEKCSSDVKTQSNQLQRCAQHSNVCIQSELSLKMKDEPSLDYKMSLNAVPNVTCQADSGLSIVDISHYNVESNKDSCESCISQCKELDRALPENKCQPEMESCTEICASNSERDIQLRIPESLSTEGGGEFTVKDKLDCIGETSLYNRPDEVEQYSVPVEDLESVQHMQSAYAESESKSLISRCSTSMLDHKSEGGLVVSNDKCDLTEKNNTLNILEENISSNVCGSMQECKLETGGISTVKLCQWRISENDSPEETCTGSSSDACISLENAEFEHINSGAVKMDLAMQPIDDGANDTVGCLAGGRTAVLGCRIADSTESNTLLKDHFSDEKDKNSSEIFDSLSEHYNCSQENSSTLVKGSSNIDSPLCVRQADTTETLPLKSAEKEVLVTEKLFSLKTSTTEEKLNVDSQSCGVEDEHLSNCAEFAKHCLDPSQDANFHQELFGSENEVRPNSQIPLQRIGFSVAQEGESPMLSAGSVLNGKTGDNVEPSINENSSVCKSPCTNEISDSSVEVMVNSDGKFRQNEVVEEESSLIRTGSSEETSSILSITTGEGKGKDEPPNDATSTVLLSDSDMADLKNSNGDENLENSPTFSALLKLNTPFSESEHVLDLPYSTDKIQSVQCHSKESECVIENEEMVQEDFGEEPHRLQNTEGKNMKLGEKQEQDNDYSFTDVLKVSRLENVPSSGDAEIEGSTSDVSISTFNHLETSTVSELLKVAVVETVNSNFEYNSCIMDRQIHGGVEKDCEGQQQAREDDFIYSNEKQKVHRDSEVDELVNGVGEPVCTAANVEHSSAEVTVEEEVTRNCSFYPQIVVNKRDVSSNNVDQMDTQRVILSNSVHNGECNMLKSEVNCKETQDVNVKTEKMMIFHPVL
ncbi:uncharacterized protein LOC122797951 [Protopterus annectens]|uniref:uncharacterized protein LOC122797951 n=1 Tax=Protopterus annectens TaxID=7888 RepID=UPI001CF965D7|nr:uncharacterized protein LOC122797951 [Protopterus annectens]